MLYDKTDYKLFALIIAAIMLLSITCLNNTCYWGDDFAAYISEGISIADGYFQKQSELNVLMHPSELPDEAQSGTLVYVWGYPLLLAVVYKLVGFDRTGFSSIIYYKLPSAIALALLGGIMYLFLRRRFGKTLSLGLAFLFCACYELRVFINTLYSDVVFLFFVMLSLLTLDVFVSSGGKKFKTGVILGLLLWFTYEIRLNGISILFAAAVACALAYFRDNNRREWKYAVVYLSPFIVFLAAKHISEALLAPATSNTSDISGVTFAAVISNISSYYYSACTWFGLVFNDAVFNWVNKLLTAMTSSGEDTYGVIQRFCDAMCSGCVSVLMLLALCGVVFKGVKKELHLTLFALVYIIVVCMLPYNQGVRYIYPVMALVPLYVGYALSCVSRFASKYIKHGLKKVLKYVELAVISMMCVLTFVSAVRGNIYSKNNTEYIVPQGQQDFYKMYAYTPCSIEVYNYIIDNTDENSVIGFYKPRALYLNTQRLSIRTDINDHSLDEVDYFLVCADVGEEQLQDCVDYAFRQIFSNDEFTFYEKIKS